MSKETCILTTKDFTILEAMRDNPLVRDDRLVPLIQRKIGTAIVVFREDLAQGVASLSSRVTFRVNGGQADTRVLSTGSVNAPVGMFLPVTTMRGLALLGLSEGQEITVTAADGHEEQILLERVDYQPETARRERHAMGGFSSVPTKPRLQMISGGLRQVRPMLAVPLNGDDDPGPSAA